MVTCAHITRSVSTKYHFLEQHTCQNIYFCYPTLLVNSVDISINLLPVFSPTFNACVHCFLVILLCLVILSSYCLDVRMTHVHLMYIRYNVFLHTS